MKVNRRRMFKARKKRYYFYRDLNSTYKVGLRGYDRPWRKDDIGSSIFFFGPWIITGIMTYLDYEQLAVQLLLGWFTLILFIALLAPNTKHNYKQEEKI